MSTRTQASPLYNDMNLSKIQLMPNGPLPQPAAEGIAATPRCPLHGYASTGQYGCDT